MPEDGAILPSQIDAVVWPGAATLAEASATRRVTIVRSTLPTLSEATVLLAVFAFMPPRIGSLPCELRKRSENLETRATSCR
jgi:hypothetical protein